MVGFYDDWVSVIAKEDDQGIPILPTRDALYGVPYGALPLAHGGVLVVLGVNHARALGAAYARCSA